MVKYIQTIRRQKPTNCLSKFDHFEGLALKGLSFACKINQNDFTDWLPFLPSNLKEKISFNPEGPRANT